MESNKYPIRKSVFNANGTLSHSILRKGNGMLKGRVGDGSVSDAVTPVPGTEESGEDGPRDGMPRTRDGTGKCRQRVEEATGKYRRETRVLHADLNGDSSLSGGVEVEQTACQIPREVS